MTKTAKSILDNLAAQARMDKAYLEYSLPNTLSVLGFAPESEDVCSALSFLSEQKYVVLDRESIQLTHSGYSESVKIGF